MNFTGLFNPDLLLQHPDLLFRLDYTGVAWAMGGVAVASLLALMALLLPRLRRVARQVEADAKSAAGIADAAVEWPPVSVIVTTSDDGAQLEKLLGQILEQDYPAPFEIVVVDIDDDKATGDAISRLQQQHTNIYRTFAPKSARSLSRKKLAITLGVKAASHEAMLITCGNCDIVSPLWMRMMARHFAQGKQIVVGYSVLRPFDAGLRQRACRRRAFDIERASAKMLYPAAKGYPLRADGNNLGLARSLFLNHKGFSRHFDLINGEDDVFIREVATRTNAAVELSPEARVAAMRNNPASEHRREVMARNFTSRFLRGAPRLPWLAASWLWWLWLATGIAALALTLPSLWMLIGLTVVNTAGCLLIGAAWRRTALLLGLRPLRLTVPWLALNHPFYLYGCHLHKDGVTNNHYVWQQELTPKT